MKQIHPAISDGRLASLQVLRGVAALMVLMHHASEHVFVHGVAPFNIGYAGVDLFFVLSGFVIFLAHHDDLGRPDRLGRYIKRRFIRIYPTYIVVTLVSLPVVLYMVPATRDWKVILASIPIVDYPAHIISVAWTLVHEVHFYVAFGLCILLPRWGALLVFSGLVATALWRLENPALSWAFPVARLDLQFAMGIAAAALHFWRPWPVLVRYGCLIGGALIFVGAAGNLIFRWWPEIIPPDREDTGFGAMLIVFGAAGLSWRSTLGQRLGDASYLIYLVHFQALAFFVAVGWKLGIRNDPFLTTTVAIGIVVASIWLHERVEAPTLERLRKGRLLPLYRRPAEGL